MMGKLHKISTMLLLFCSVIIFAQVPQRMNYQSVIRDATGNLVANTNVGIKISILENSISGTAVYSETHTAATNDNGLVTLEIGGGNVVLGNFSTISWGNGSHFIKTEIDPTGGTNYTITGSSQLLSVPYALYAGTNKNYGKTTIYIMGPLTDAQVQAKLDAELGENTENIYIRDCPLVTTVNLASVKSLSNLQISNNPNLTNVDLSGLKDVYESFTLNANPALSTLPLTSLSNVYCKINILNSALTAFSVAASGIFYKELTISGNPALTAINLPGISYIFSLSVSNNPMLSTVDSSGLSTSSLSFSGTNSLNTLLLTNLSQGSLACSNSTLTNLSLPSFTTGSLNIYSNPLLASINLPSFTTAVNGIAISFNPNLNNISMPLFSALALPLSGVYLRMNMLPSAQVNQFLHQFLTVTPSSGKLIDLKQQAGSPAPPTGQGLIDKQTLISTGNSVLTD